ncbi:MAG: 2-hydroxyacyl-CoA dehydratase family protein, partial [candidate division WOR-3 bacterium]
MTIESGVRYQDPLPRRISLQEWDEQFQAVPDELIQRYHYFSKPAKQGAQACDETHGAGNTYPWATYLFPPTLFAVYGSRHLRRLKFDNSLASLRLWGFVMNETERLFRARQIGRKIIATMGDLGATPPLVLSFPGALPFYPDCIWWVPFTNESMVLFEAAAKLGIGESACYSRASLGAFTKGAYFPYPVLCIASTGASCDDYSAVEQLVEGLGFPVFWFELPLRRDTPCPAHRGRAAVSKDLACPAQSEKGQVASRTRDDRVTDPNQVARDLLIGQFACLRERLSSVLNQEADDAQVWDGIRQVNRVRRIVGRINDKVYSAPASVFPALEMMVIEFGNLHFYSDIGEWQAILEHIEATID